MEKMAVTNEYLLEVLTSRLVELVSRGVLDRGVIDSIEDVGIEKVLEHIRFQLPVKETVVYGTKTHWGSEYDLSDKAQARQAVDDFFFDGSFDALVDQHYSGF